MKRTGIKRKISKKRNAQVREYNNVTRPEYLKDHPDCEVRGCGQPATQIHHKKGRIGALLNDKEFFLASCLYDHEFIEQHPIWAKEMGYSLNRL